MFNIKVDVKAITDAMKKLGDHQSSDLMASIAASLASATETAFAEEKDPNTGEAWQPLTEAYAEKKALISSGGLILERKGDLKARIVTDHSIREAMAGSNLVYAGTHQFGNPDLNIPARPYLGIDQVAEEEILDAINDHYAKAFR